MKRLLLFLPLLVLAGTSLAFGQNSAIPGFTMTVGPGNLTRAIPFAPLVICNYPATGGTPCTNFAFTSTGPTGSTGCPIATPAVIPTTTTCTGFSDRDGNFVFFAPAGTTIPIPYTYYFQYNNTWNGPYVVTASGGGGGGGGGSINLLTNGVANSVQTQLNLAQGSGITLVNAGGTTTISSAGILGATSGGGLVPTGSTLGLLTTCSPGQVEAWNGAAWACASATGIGGSGTFGTIPIWAGPGTLGNSNLTDVAGTGVNYALGGGLSWQIDGSHITFNSGVSGAGTPYVIIANTYAAGSSNNAGGMEIAGANATGSACAGNVLLMGGSTNGAGNSSNINVNGACSNGFGAGGANVVITAGSTAASNSGGNVVLTPGTGGFGNGQVTITRGGLVVQGTASSSFGGPLTLAITGLTQCLHVSSTGLISGTGSDCSPLGYPPGTGIPQVVGGTAWGSTLSTTGSGNVVLSNSPALVTPNLGTPSALVLTNATGAPTWNQNTTGTAANLLGCTPATAGSVCIFNGSVWTLFAGNTSGTASLQENASGVPSWGAGSATTFQVNGTGLISATTVNFLNSAATDGLTLTFTNGSAGQVTLGFTGTLTNAGLANPATTVNSQTCTLGSPCTIPFQTNTVNNTSQAGINLKPSTVNAVGLTVTPTNTGTNIDTFEITGGSYSGNAAGLFGTPSITVNGITATTYNGGTLAGTFPGSPTFSGNPNFTGSPVFNMTGGPFCVQETAGVLSSTGSACGSGGGGSISGTPNFIAYFATSSTLGSVGSVISGTVPVFQNGGPPIATSPALVDSSTSPVITATYTLQCDSATTIIDRSHIVRLGTGSSVVAVPLSSGSGCAGLVTVLRNDSATAVTVNKTSTDTFTIFNGSANLDAQTTYQLGSGQSATISQSQTGIWEIATPQGGTITGITTAGGSGLAGGGTTGTLSLSIAAGGVTNAMLAGNITLANLAMQSANTLVANFTGSTVAPVAYAMASCSGNNQGEIYTSSTGLGCGSNFGQLNVASTWSANQTLTGHLIISGHDLTIPLACADTSGSGTAQVCNTSPTFTPVAGDRIAYTTTTANTGAGLTINVNSLGAKSVAKWQNSTTLAANDVRANVQVLLSYDGTNWELDTIGNGPVGTGTVTVVASGSLTSTALVTGGGSQTLQTASATSTLSSGGNMSLAGTIAATLATLSGNGAASTAGLALTGTAYTAGSASTNLPQLYLNSGASGPSTFSANGTQFGINPVSGFTGNDVDLHAPNGGASVFVIDYQGNVTIGGCAGGTFVKADGTGCGFSGLSTITAATVNTTIANGNFNETWNGALTTDAQQIFNVGETSAAINGTLTNGIAAQAVLGLSTLTNSTASPLKVAQGSITNTVATPLAEFTGTWNNASLAGMGLFLNITNTASANGSRVLNLLINNSSLLSVDKNGDARVAGSLNLGGSTCSTFGTAGNICAFEGTADTNLGSNSVLYPDSTAHEWKAATAGATSYGMMVRAQPGSIRSTGLVASVSTATLCAASAGACNVAGTYHIHFSLYQSGTACTANTTNGVSVALTWTDANATAHSAQIMPMDVAGGAIGTTGVLPWLQTTLGAAGSVDFNVDTNGTIIQYATNFTQCTTGTATYALSGVVTRLQ